MNEKFRLDSNHAARRWQAWLILAALAALLVSALAQTPPQNGAQRHILMKQDLSNFPGHEGVVARVEFAPGAKEPKHTHPGDLFGYVQEGALILSIEGKEPVEINQGEVFFVPAGKVHWGENARKTPTTTVVTFVVEKGKPLTSPAQ